MQVWSLLPGSGMGLGGGELGEGPSQNLGL